MKQFVFAGLAVLALLGLTACSSGAGTDQTQPEQTGQALESTGDMHRGDLTSQAQTEYISAVPEEYFAPSGRPGQVAEIAGLDIGHSEIVDHSDPKFVQMLHQMKIHE